MKTKLLVLLTSIVMVSGCENENIIKKPFHINIDNGHGWGWIHTEIDCDSFKMITPMECKAYYNGSEMLIKGEQLSPSTNRH